MKFFLPLALFIVILTESNALSNSSFGLGYRRDEIKTETNSSSGDLKSTIKENELNSIMEVIDMQFFFNKWLFGFVVDYGVLVSGNRNSDSFLTGLPPLNFTAKDDYGYEVDVFPKIGYSFNLSREANPTRFILGLGYGYSRVSTRIKKPTPITLSNVMPGINEQVFLFDTASFRYEWYGPFLEGKFDISLSHYWRCAIGYQYHFLKGKTKQPIFLQIDALNGSSLFMQRDLTTTLKSTISSASKNWGVASISYLPAPGAALRLEGTISKCSSHHATQSAKIKSQTLSPLSPATFGVASEQNSIKQSWFNAALILFVDVLF